MIRNIFRLITAKRTSCQGRKVRRRTVKGVGFGAVPNDCSSGGAVLVIVAIGLTPG